MEETQMKMNMIANKKISLKMIIPNRIRTKKSGHESFMKII